MHTYVFQHIKTKVEITIKASNILKANFEAYKFYGDFNYLIISTDGKKHINR